MKPRIMWASDSTFLPTGFSNQTMQILRELSKNYECLEWSHQYGGNELVQLTQHGIQQPIEPWVHLPAAYSSYGQGQIEQSIKRFTPSIVAWLCDSFMLTQAQAHAGPRNDWVIHLINKLKNEGNQTKFLHYYPLDSEDIYQGVAEELAVMDYRVAMSKFARDFVKKETGLDSHYIPHCCDTYNYQPLAQEERDKIKASAGLAGKFVIGSVGRNQSRKMPNRMAYVMKEFCKDKKDVVLLMHCDPMDPQAGVNTPEIISSCGFKPKSILQYVDGRGNEIRFTGVSWSNGFPANKVNEIYNAMDVHTMCTTGEGFGITTIEAMACGIPNVVTDYTTTRELLLDDGECGIPAPYNNFINGGLNTKRALIDSQAFAAALQRYYDSESLRKKHGQMGREKAVAFYSQQVVLPQWTKLFAEIMEAEEGVKLRCE